MSDKDPEHTPNQDPTISPDSGSIGSEDGQNEEPATPRGAKAAAYTGELVIREQLVSDGLPVGAYTVVDDEGNIITIDEADPVDLSELRTPPQIPAVQERLSGAEQEKLSSVKSDLARLQLLSGGLELLLESRPAVDPTYEGDRAKLVGTTRLATLRLIRDISELRNVIYANHPDSPEIGLLLDSISEVLDNEKIIELQRLFVGGLKGKNTKANQLSHEVSIAVSRRGLVDERSTSGVAIKGRKGLMLFVSEIDEQTE